MKCAPIPVSYGSVQFAVLCAGCRWRTPVVADRRTAKQAYDTHAAEAKQ